MHACCTGQVLALAINSGLVNYPVRYESAFESEGLSVWAPVPPKGYAALGFMATAGPEPPALTAMVCPHTCVCVESELGMCLALGPRANIHAGDKAEGAYVWCVDNAGATFQLCDAKQGSPEGASSV